jgi:hypothetical protein
MGAPMVQMLYKYLEAVQNFNFNKQKQL